MTSQRRPHWDDDLIDAVNACLDTSGDTITFDAYAVIAAVEDWQIERNKGYMGQHELGIIHTITELEFDAEQAEATIKRVRELHSHRMGSRYCVCAECGDNVAYPCATRFLVDDDPWAFLRALDGDA